MSTEPYAWAQKHSCHIHRCLLKCVNTVVLQRHAHRDRKTWTKWYSDTDKSDNCRVTPSKMKVHAYRSQETHRCLETQVYVCGHTHTHTQKSIQRETKRRRQVATQSLTLRYTCQHTYPNLSSSMLETETDTHMHLAVASSPPVKVFPFCTESSKVISVCLETSLTLSSPLLLYLDYFEV